MAAEIGVPAEEHHEGGELVHSVLRPLLCQDKHDRLHIQERPAHAPMTTATADVNQDKTRYERKKTRYNTPIRRGKGRDSTFTKSEVGERKCGVLDQLSEEMRHNTPA